MALPTLFKRKKPAADLAASPAKAGHESAAARTSVPGGGGTPETPERAARTRARRRLIGAAVLLVAGVIAFPLLFESQPRPIPVDIPLVIPGRDAVPALAAPARPTKPAAASEAPAKPEPASSAPAAVAPTPAAAPATAASKPLPPSDPKPEPRPPVAKPEPKPEPKPAPKTEPKADPKPAPKAAAAKPEPPRSRYVVQIGAFNDEAAARKARLEVERLGLKTYTQVVDVGGVRKVRVRIGPYESQQEANKAMASLKAAKLSGSVLAL